MEDLSLETTSFSLDREPPAQPDRREGKRHLTLFRVGVISVDDRRELCLIKNISAGGMSIRPYCVLAAGERVVIELKSGMSVPGVVAWTDGGSAGIEFDEPVEVLDILAAANDRPRPRMPRIAIDCFATVRDGANVHRLRVCDISQGGVKLAGEVAIDAANDLAVTLPGLPPQPAALRWNGGGHLGITFNRLLPLAELVEWLRAIREQPRAA
ncbi:PilZ domain-containing protein [Sphingomonas mesophila]|uniref:PilZ domain-containing protein n=1 Tax=Sphingomonas mesophila TaxID=2303576 RepID=UPI000E56C159|nr:PilZ domain-containing protein [Sphingomonas mesophila]